MEYLLWVLVALVAYSLLAPLVGFVTREIPAVTALFLSTGVFLVLTLAVMLVTDTADPSYVHAPSAGYVYVAGGFLAVGILAYFFALEAGPVSIVVPIFGMFVVGSAVLGIVFLDEPFTGTRAAGIGCAVLAIYLSTGGEA